MDVHIIMFSIYRVGQFREKCTSDTELMNNLCGRRIYIWIAYMLNIWDKLSYLNSNNAAIKWIFHFHTKYLFVSCWTYILRGTALLFIFKFCFLQDWVSSRRGLHVFPSLNNLEKVTFVTLPQIKTVTGTECRLTNRQIFLLRKSVQFKKTGEA